MGGLPIVHVRIAFRPDYADLLANCDIFRNVAAIGAVPEGQWGQRVLRRPAAAGRQRARVRRQAHAHQRLLRHAVGRDAARAGRAPAVVAGVATHSVVEGTVRHAADIGFNVMVAEDACASADPAVHDASLASMRLIAQTGSVAEAMRWAAAH